MTTERPILFSGPMVRAILDGTKTQTRRIAKPCAGLEWLDEENGIVAPKTGDKWPHFDIEEMRSPYGREGDHLWVRETHAIVPRTAYRMSEGVQQTLKPGCDHDAAVYKCGWDRSYPGRWRPSIHMPRWASRITLEITSVRVERLMEISEEDAVAEGCYTNEQYTDLAGQENAWPCCICNGFQVHGTAGANMGWTEVDCVNCDTPKKRFKALWQSINGPESWDANPWVWVIEFKRLINEV